MKEKNPIYRKHYENYLQQLSAIDLAERAPVLGITAEENSETVVVSFFNQRYRISRSGIEDEAGNRPDYVTCVILLKYLLMGPQQVPVEKEWMHFRDFKDSVQAQNAGLSAYASKAISKHYAGSLDRLKNAANELGGIPPETDYPYDLAAVFRALPRVPILFLFNDADDLFPAEVSILYERRAEHFLDAECRVMVDLCLLTHLKKAEQIPLTV